jgi:hypothetical protein
MTTMKFTTNHNEFFKEWRAGEIRILKDVCANTFHPYQIQKFDGKHWFKICACRTLAEAKAKCEINK